MVATSDCQVCILINEMPQAVALPVNTALLTLDACGVSSSSKDAVLQAVTAEFNPLSPRLASLLAEVSWLDCLAPLCLLRHKSSRVQAEAAAGWLARFVQQATQYEGKAAFCQRQLAAAYYVLCREATHHPLLLIHLPATLSPEPAQCLPCSMWPPASKPKTCLCCSSYVQQAF